MLRKTNCMKHYPSLTTVPAHQIDWLNGTLPLQFGKELTGTLTGGTEHCPVQFCKELSRKVSS